MNIYVGNLDFKVNENDLEEVFKEYGEVSSARVIVDKYSGRSRGFGFVEMANNSEGNKAIEELNGATYEDRVLKVNESKPKKRY